MSVTVFLLLPTALQLALDMVNLRKVKLSEVGWLTQSNGRLQGLLFTTSCPFPHLQGSPVHWQWAGAGHATGNTADPPPSQSTHHGAPLDFHQDDSGYRPVIWTSWGVHVPSTCPQEWLKESGLALPQVSAHGGQLDSGYHHNKCSHPWLINTTFRNLSSRNAWICTEGHRPKNITALFVI